LQESDKNGQVFCYHMCFDYSRELSTI